MRALFSSIEIIPDKAEYSPGESINAAIILNLGKRLKARAIYATLVCDEKHKTKHMRNIPLAEVEERKSLGLYTPAPYTQEVEQVEHHVHYKEEKKVAEAGEYEKQQFAVSFNLPGDARPSSHDFGHDSRIVEWILNVKVDIAWSPDVNASKEVYVAGEL